MFSILGYLFPTGCPFRGSTNPSVARQWLKTWKHETLEHFGSSVLHAAWRSFQDHTKPFCCSSRETASSTLFAAALFGYSPKHGEANDPLAPCQRPAHLPFKSIVNLYMFLLVMCSFLVVYKNGQIRAYTVVPSSKVNVSFGDRLKLWPPKGCF